MEYFSHVDKHLETVEGILALGSKSAYISVSTW